MTKIKTNGLTKTFIKSPLKQLSLWPEDIENQAKQNADLHTLFPVAESDCRFLKHEKQFQNTKTKANEFIQFSKNEQAE